MAVLPDVHEVRSRPGKRQVPYVVFEQSGVLVVYKPPHWTMTTTMEMPRKTSIQAWLGDSLGHYYPYLQEDPLQAGLVQRLDVETSGPVVVATRSETFRKMWQLRSAGHFYREYVALLHGALPARHSCGTLEYSLNTRHRSSKVSERHGQPARTRYQAVAAFSRRAGGGAPPAAGAPAGGAARCYTLLRVRILTGRLHQIRVHLRELARRLGLPVCGLVGDYKYLPRAELLRDREFCPRVFLHARVLRFPLPGQRRELCRISCELPLDLTRVLRELTPNDELTAEFTKVGDFLHCEQPGSFVPAIRSVYVTMDVSPSRARSRSPSHWRASSSAASETSEDGADEFPEETRLFLEGGEEPEPHWSSLEAIRNRSPSPCHWRPPSSPSPSECRNTSSSPARRASVSPGRDAPVDFDKPQAARRSPEVSDQPCLLSPAEDDRRLPGARSASQERSQAAQCCLSILDQLIDGPTAPQGDQPALPPRSPGRGASPVLAPERSAASASTFVVPVALAEQRINGAASAAVVAAVAADLLDAADGHGADSSMPEHVNGDGASRSAAVANPADPADCKGATPGMPEQSTVEEAAGSAAAADLLEPADDKGATSSGPEQKVGGAAAPLLPRGAGVGGGTAEPPAAPVPCVGEPLSPTVPASPEDSVVPEPTGPGVAVGKAPSVPRQVECRSPGAGGECFQGVQLPRARKRAALAALDTLTKRRRDDPFGLWSQ